MSQKRDSELIVRGVIDRLIVVEDQSRYIRNEIQQLCHDIRSIDTIREAIGILDRETIEVMIVDLDFTGPLKEDDLYNLLYQHENPPDLIAVADDRKTLGELVHYPAIEVLEKPLRFPDILGAISKQIETKEGTTILRVEDYLQMLSFGRHTIRLEVEIADGLEGFVDLLDGRVSKAKFLDLTGFEALRSLVLSPANAIKMVPRPSEPVPIEDDFSESVPALLLRIMAEEDESNAEAIDAALGALDEAPQESPFESLLREAMEAYLERRLDRAESLFEQCLELRPDDPRCRHNLDRIRQKKGS